MLEYQIVILRLLLAVLLGGIVGLERERLEWAAGLRTHMLVCLGAAVVMIVSSFGFADVLGSAQVILDPSRVAAQVVSGIGFLGAGTILFLRQEIIRGLTTAASLWAVAAVGLAVGGGLYVAAAAATILVLVILAVVKPLERHLFHRHRSRHLSIRAERQRISLPQLDSTLGSFGIEVAEITVKRSGTSGEEEIRVTLQRNLSRSALSPVVSQLRDLPGVSEITF